jgi:hypothetical protein
MVDIKKASFGRERLRRQRRGSDQLATFSAFYGELRRNKEFGALYLLGRHLY